MFNDVIVKYVDDVDKFWSLTLTVGTVNKELIPRTGLCLLAAVVY